MSKVSCKAAGKRRRRLCEWRGLSCYDFLIDFEKNTGQMQELVIL